MHGLKAGHSFAVPDNARRRVAKWMRHPTIQRRVRRDTTADALGRNNLDIKGFCQRLGLEQQMAVHGSPPHQQQARPPACLLPRHSRLASCWAVAVCIVSV